MKDKKLQIFVSSTFMDLKEERQAAVEAILSSGHIPAGMELFSAGDESQMTVIKRWINESDIYLLILGGRYGSIEPVSGKSYTHLEFEYAIEIQKPLFAIIISDVALDSKIKEKGRAVIEQENTKEFKEFKATVLSNLVKFWDDKKDIKLAIHETISDFSYRKDLIGWTRGDNAVNTGFLAEEIARLSKENSELKVQISQNNNTENTVLYSGLTYNQLEELLKIEIIENNGQNINLYEFLLQNGELFLHKSPILIPLARKIQKLVSFNVLEKTGSSSGYHRFAFTTDGHKFYLKTLYFTQLI